MAVRQLRMFDDEILRKQCKEVTVIDEKVKCLIEDMGDGLLKLISEDCCGRRSTCEVFLS